MPALLPALLTETARKLPAATALACGAGRWSYAELDRLAERLAAALQALGVERQRVGLLLPNRPVFAAALYGILRASGRAVMLNPQYSRRETGEVLADAGATGVLTVEGLLPLLPAGVPAWTVDDLPARLRVRAGGGKHDFPLPDHGAGRATARPGDEALVVYTAATRGWARGARLSHRNLLANARSTVQAMQLEPADRVAAVLPFSHLFGQTVALNAPLSIGARVVPIERFNPARLLDLLEQERITVLCGVPGVFGALLSAAERRSPTEHALRVAISGGSPLPPTVAHRWEDLFGIPLRQGYGLTEASPVCLFNHLDRPNQPGTLGYPFPGVEVSIRDPWGVALPPREVGEICVRGDNVFLGYVGESGRQPGDFWGDWLRTGDLGSLESSGAVRFRGLLKPMFARNGFNVYPAEVARVLEADSRVAGAYVCALPDPVRENEIVLYIRPQAGAQLSQEDVVALCTATLASFKQPSRIEVATATDDVEPGGEVRSRGSGFSRERE